MADANKRINLTAPLLSVRRHGGIGGGGGSGAETTATGLPLPAYMADATTSELPGHHTSAVVPFGWEQRPGHPKSVRTRRPPAPPPPPLTIVDVDVPSRVTRNPTTAVVTVASERARRGEERFSDALSRDDVLSCVTVNCSATGLSDATVAGAGAGSMPCARGSVMMDRFLPAAHAMAAGSPQNTFRKARSAREPAVLGARTGTAGGDRAVPAQRRVALQHIASYHLPPLPPSAKIDDGDDDDDDDANSDAHSTAGFASRRCGLLSTRCLMSALLLSRGARRGAGRPFQGVCGELLPPPPPPRSRNGQQRLPPHTGDDHGMISQQSWEEVYIKSLLRSSGHGGLMGPAAAVASELDRTVRELYRRRDGQAVRPKASHLGLLLVLDRSKEACGGDGSPARKLSRRTGDDTALLLKATTRNSPDGEEQLGRERGGGGYGFPLLLEDKEAVAGREMALSPSPQPQTLLPLPLPKSPTESWLSRALPSVSTRPPATSFLGLHVQTKKRAPLTWCSIDSSRLSRDVHHDKHRQIRVHDLQK